MSGLDASRGQVSGDMRPDGQIIALRSRSVTGCDRRHRGGPRWLRGSPLTRGLRQNGWRLLDRGPRTLDEYQAYLRTSRAEFGVAKAGYVVSASGWFSERSVAYLASGRPVVVQSTGFEEWLPSGLGVLPFATPDDAMSALDDLATRYAEHCRASRDLGS